MDITKPYIMCIVEKDKFVFYYISTDRICNFGFMNRIGIKTVDQIIKKFEYNDIDEVLFKHVVSENEEFEQFLNTVYANSECVCNRYNGFSFILPIEKEPIYGLDIVYKAGENGDEIDISLEYINKELENFDIWLCAIYSNDERFNVNFIYNEDISKRIGADINNKLHIILKSDYVESIVHHIYDNCEKFINMKPEEGTVLRYNFTKNIQEGERNE